MRNTTARNALVGAALSLALPAAAEPVARSLPAAGSVIARKSGEEVRFFDVSNWRYVDLAQDLLSGDVLRTNATGQLAVLFSDRTQVRLGRNTALLVKQMGNRGDTGLELQSGTIWARAERGGQNLTVDTPAAAAAIRGTDWTLTVGADGKTSLIVLEGVVELSNAFGSVQVSQGEGAVAAIGQAPSKIIIAQPKDREQMLFNLSLRSAFGWMPATPLRTPDMRRERQRIEADAENGRSAEDWLSLSEVYLTLDGKNKANTALAKARALGLSGRQRSRALLVDALMAGSENRYADAAALFAQSMPGLDAKRRAVAAYGGYFARSLADPNRVEEPPRSTAGFGALGKAFVAGFRQDLKAAVDTIRAAEQSDPNDPTLPAARAKIALLLGDEKELVDGFTRSLAIDPADPTGLETRADYKFYIANNYEAALDDLNEALKTAPGNSSLWNTIGLVQSSREANREAERAFKKAIELDPFDPVGHANLAMLYLDEMRMAEAKAEIDKALEVDPSFDIALVARGRYHMQTGDREKAVDDLLAGSTANPGYSQAQLLLAAAHYEKGDRVPAAQALDNADRLDPADPVVSVVRTALAIDEYDADAAIRNAQEVLRRTRARGGDYAPLGANQQGGSTLNDAFRLQGLNAWGQYYGDVVFDPFTGSSFIDQAVRGTVDPFFNAPGYEGNALVDATSGGAFSSFLQGLLVEPHMLASRERTVNLLQQPFLEASLLGGVVATEDHTGRTAGAELRGMTMAPYPISFFGTLTWQEDPLTTFTALGENVERSVSQLSGTGYVTASPTPDDRIVSYFSSGWSNNKLYIPLEPPRFPFDGDYSDTAETDQTLAGVGWSHTFAYRNVLNTALLYSDRSTKIGHNEIVETGVGGLGARTLEESKQSNVIAAINHTVGDDDLYWRYGVEGGLADTKSRTFASLFAPGSGPVSFSVEEEEQHLIGKAYMDGLAEITPDLKVEGALFARFVEDSNDNDVMLEPRMGVAWSPTDGHWLRAGLIREGNPFDTPTLSPIGVAGLLANQTDVAADGYTDTLALRWDAEWNNRLFTALDFQHQEIENLAISIPSSTSSIDLSEGRIDRLALTTNLALGHGFGVSATAAYTKSKNLDPSRTPGAERLPFVPETSGQIALTWVNTANIKTSLAANYVGKRDGDAAGTELDDFWTLDATLQWEPFDKRFEVQVGAYNLLDADFDLASNLPGWGPTIKGTVKARF
ncbi:TonB-dependent receptor [Rhizobium sp. 58]|nr:TonB-dependent receptor [Rhizobium sp. 58]